ncbi:hypothetical protein SAY87_025570 [Trapa incisa]|uniref:Uncharacterized protein n=1 Tax=Trapa incisa TaxID=236973 RepID=A0AAN7JGA0_9MYRT|nr:hypothetical protein SAY87_025570 [Trapa incisa]
MSSTTAATGTKCHNYHPQAPKIVLRLRRRTDRRKDRRSGRASHGGSSRSDRSGNDTKLQTLFDRECVLSKGGGSGGVSSVEMDDEKWRFQAEVLRTECNILRMEKEIAVRKLDRSRLHLEQTLRSATEALISMRKKICEGKNVAGVLEEEIRNLVDKLKELRKSPGSVKYAARPDRRGGGGGNFDQRVTILQKRLQKLGGSSEEKRCMEKIRKMAVESLSMTMVTCPPAEDPEGSSILFEPASDGSMSGSTSGSKPAAVQCLGHYVPFTLRSEPEVSSSERSTSSCSGHCKAVVRRIVEQVRAETEQWSQLQEMLGQVRDEMEELLASRDFWEDRARDSDSQKRSLHSSVQEWRQRALLSEAKAKELRLEMSTLRDQMGALKKNDLMLSHAAMAGESPLPPLVTAGSRNEAENRPVLTCSPKENHHNGDEAALLGIMDRRRKVRGCTAVSSVGVSGLKRSPLRDIGNTARRDGKPVLPLICHLNLN